MQPPLSPWAKWMKSLFGPPRRRPAQARDTGQAFLHISGGPFVQPPLREVGQAFEEARHDMRRRGRLSAWLALTWTVCGVGFVGFVCWCAYHVLKAKHLVP